MDQVLQSSQQKRRPWTAQDQVTAEVMAACEVSCREIGRALNRSHSSVRKRLSPSFAEMSREYGRRWRQSNPDRMRELSRRHYESNRDKAIQRSRLWRLANPDKMREHRRRWRRLNPKNSREMSRRYYNANREKSIEAGRKWRQANQNLMRVFCRRWHAANPENVRERNRRRNAWKRAARQRALVPVTRAQIDARFGLWSNRCAFCGVAADHQRNRGYERLTVEHVLALTKGGLDEAPNILPACSTCNSSKNNSPVETWYRCQPFFTEARWRKIQRHCPAAASGQLPLAMV